MVCGAGAGAGAVQDAARAVWGARRVGRLAGLRRVERGAFLAALLGRLRAALRLLRGFRWGLAGGALASLPSGAWLTAAECSTARGRGGQVWREKQRRCACRYTHSLVVPGRMSAAAALRTGAGGRRWRAYPPAGWPGQ